MAERITALYQKLKPFIVRDLGSRSLSIVSGGGGGGGAAGPHDLDDTDIHLGTLAESQAPWVATNLSAAISAHAALPDVHHDRVTATDSTILVSGQALSVNLAANSGLTVASGLSLGTPGSLSATSTNALSGTSHTHAVTAYSDLKANPGNLAKADGSGFIEFSKVTTDALESDGTLLVTPGTRVTLADEKEIRSLTTVTGLFGAGWRLENPGGQSFLDIRKIQVEELRAYLFIADFVRVQIGEDFITESMGVLYQDFTTPLTVGGTGTLIVEDVPFFSGALFANNDWVMLFLIDRSGGGITIARFWGQVSGYVDLGADSEGVARQQWTYTHRSGSTDTLVKKGSIVMGWGQPGSSYIHHSVVDFAGSPYTRYASWDGDNPYTPLNRHVHTQVGNLDSLPDDPFGLEPEGYGLYGTNVYLKGNLYAAGGDVRILDGEGINLAAGASATIYDPLSVTWWNDIADRTGDPALSMYTYTTTVEGVDGYYTQGTIQSNGFSGGYSGIELVARGSVSLDLAGRISISSTRMDTGVGTRSTITLQAAQVIVGTSVANSTVDINAPDTNTKHVKPLTDLTYDLGTASKRYRAIYVDQLNAATIAGDTMSGQEWEYPGNMTIDANSGGDTVVAVVNQGAGSADFSVDRNITLGGTVDGVDVAALGGSYAAHITNADAHHDQVHVLATNAGLGLDHTISGATAGHALVAQSAVTARFEAVNHNTLSGVSADQHHAQSHVLATTSALGPDHTVAGLTAGQVLKATGTSTVAFGVLAHNQLSGIGANDHHNQAHVLATTSALGPDHTVSGLTTGQVLQATDTNIAAFAALDHDDLANVTPNQHHNQIHQLANASALGPDHTIAGAASGQVLRASAATAANFSYLGHDDLTGVTPNQHHNQSHVLATNLTIGADHTVSGLTVGQVLFATSATTARFQALDHDYLTNVTPNQHHYILTLGTNTASALSLTGTGGQVLNLADVFVQIAGDHMSGSLYLDSVPIFVDAGGTTVSKIGKWAFGNAGVLTDATLGFHSLTGATDYNLWANSLGEFTINAPDGQVVNFAIGGENKGRIAADGNWIISNDSDAVPSPLGMLTVAVMENDTLAALVIDSSPSHIGSSIVVNKNGILQWDFNGAGNIQPGLSIEYDLGAYNRKLRTIFAAELYVETLVAQDVMATIGGRVMVAPTSWLTEDLGATDTEIFLKHDSFVTNEWMFMQGMDVNGSPQYEPIRMTSDALVPSGGEAGYRYTVTRQEPPAWTVDTYYYVGDLVKTGGFFYVNETHHFSTLSGGTGPPPGGPAWTFVGAVNPFAKSWLEGDAIVSLGRDPGQGYIDLASTKTIHNQIGPTVAVYSRHSATKWNDVYGVVAMGSLQNWLDYSTSEPGFAVGNNLALHPTASGTFKGFAVDASNGIRMFNAPITFFSGATKTMMLTNTPSITLSHGGADTITFATGAGVWMGIDSSVAKMRIGSTSKYLSYDGTDLTLRDSDFRIYAGANIVVKIDTIPAIRVSTDVSTFTYAAGTGFFAGLDSSVFKLRIGTTTKYFRYDGTNLELRDAAFNIYSGADPVITLDTTPAIKVSLDTSTLTYAAGTGFWTGLDSGTFKMRVGTTTNYLRFDGSNVQVRGSLTAGTGGEVIADSSGLRIIVGSPGSMSGANQLQFVDTDGTTILGLVTRELSATNSFTFGATSVSGRMRVAAHRGISGGIPGVATAFLDAFASNGGTANTGYLVLEARSDAGSVSNRIELDHANGMDIQTVSKDMNIQTITSGTLEIFGATELNLLSSGPILLNTGLTYVALNTGSLILQHDTTYLTMTPNLVQVQATMIVGDAATPLTQFEVRSSSGGITLTRTSDTADVDPFLLLRKGSTPANIAQIRGLTGGGLKITNGAATVEWARFDSSGNMAIGNAITPGVQFHIQGATALMRVQRDNGSSGIQLGTSGTTADGGSIYAAGSGLVGLRFLQTFGGTEMARITPVGLNVGSGTAAVISDGVGIDVSGKILRLRTSKTPASSGATGNVGEICWDASFIYVCTATNTWERAAIATW